MERKEKAPSELALGKGANKCNRSHNSTENPDCQRNREGLLYCKKHDTWCALISLEDGSCNSNIPCPAEHGKEEGKWQ